MKYIEKDGRHIQVGDSGSYASKPGALMTCADVKAGKSGHAEGAAPPPPRKVTPLKVKRVK